MQGLTVDRAVVSLAKIFAPGQAYVALSRVRTLSGLVLQDFKENRIYCREDVKEAMNNMAPFVTRNLLQHTLHPHSFTVFYMNVQSLTRHVADLTACAQHFQPNCIAVTETWLSATSTLESVKIDVFSFYNSPRSSSYSSSHPALIALQDQQHGGAGMYRSENVVCDILDVQRLNLECVVSRFDRWNIVMAVVYRPPSYPVSLFKKNLGHLLAYLDPLSNTVVVMGDFNDDIFKSSTISQFVTSRGYVQLVNQSTTEKGTSIDHVYVKTTQYHVEAKVVPTYFSDHEGVVLSCW